MSGTPIRPTPRKTSGLHHIRRKSRKMAESFTESSFSASMVESDETSDETEESPQTSAARSLAFLTNSTASLRPKESRHHAPPDRQTITCVGRKLHNLLKLPKAYRFCCYEWFYSTIDRPLFENDHDDFSSLLKAYFPNLKTRMLTKAQWGQIRRLMGKPRRCSPAFLAQERRSLEDKRQVMRDLRSNKPVTSNYDIREVPAALTIGTHVTAWLHGPPSENKFGLFTGVVEAIDQANGQYRIRFDRKGLGTHNVHDCDVLSNGRVETVPVSPMNIVNQPSDKHSSMLTPFTPGLTPPRYVSGTPGGTPVPQLMNDPHMGVPEATPIYNSTPIAKPGTRVASSAGAGAGGQDTLRGFPVEFLKVVAQLTKILQYKRERITRLKELNSEAERMDLLQRPRTTEFQQQYSIVLLDLEALNLHLNQTMPKVTMWCGKLNPNSVELPMSIPDTCNTKASQMVSNFNVSNDGARRVRSDRAVQLITRLVSLLLQLQEASRGSTVNAYELGCIHESLQELKNDPGLVSPSNVGMFENSVEVHIQHIMTGLYQRGSLYQYSMAQAQITHQPQVQQQQQLFQQQHRTIPMSAAASNTSMASRASSSSSAGHPLTMPEMQPLLNPTLPAMAPRQADHLPAQHQNQMSYVPATAQPRAF